MSSVSVLTVVTLLGAGIVFRPMLKHYYPQSPNQGLKHPIEKELDLPEIFPPHYINPQAVDFVQDVRLHIRRVRLKTLN